MLSLYTASLLFLPAASHLLPWDRSFAFIPRCTAPLPRLPCLSATVRGTATLTSFLQAPVAAPARLLTLPGLKRACAHAPSPPAPASAGITTLPTGTDIWPHCLAPSSVNCMQWPYHSAQAAPTLHGVAMQHPTPPLCPAYLPFAFLILYIDITHFLALRAPPRLLHKHAPTCAVHYCRHMTFTHPPTPAVKTHLM